MPRAAFQGRAKNRFLPSSLSFSPRFLLPLALAFTSFCFRVRGYVAATLFSGEIPRSAIYIFDVASSTPLMLLVRNLPARPVRFLLLFFSASFRFLAALPLLLNHSPLSVRRSTIPGDPSSATPYYSKRQLLTQGKKCSRKRCACVRVRSSTCSRRKVGDFV